MSLSATFLRQLPAGRRADFSDVAELDDVLLAMLAAGQEHWPAVRLSAEIFVSFLADCVGAKSTPDPTLAKLRSDELYLTCACVQGNAEALLAFDQHYLAAAAKSLMQMRLSPDQVEEVLQLVRQKLLVAQEGVSPRLASFGGWAPLRNWLRVTFLHTAVSLYRKTARELLFEGNEWVEVPATDDDPELQYIKRVYRQEFKAAFQEAVSGLDARDRNLLRLYYIGGLNIDKIGQIYQVHRTTSARWIVKIREKLLATTRENLGEKMQLSQDEVDSMIGVIQSNFGVSVHRFLAEDEDG